MMTVPSRSAVGWLWPLAAAATLLAGVCLAQAPYQAVKKEPAKLPEGLTQITKEHLLTKIPNFFFFDYEGEPQPGKRLWLRIDDKHWVERYPDGLESKFQMLGRMKIDGESGTVTVKIAGDPARTNTPNDGTFYVFIPDKGNVEMVLRVSRGSIKGLAGQVWKTPDLEKIE
jgi:hypothetical protein